MWLRERLGTPTVPKSNPYRWMYFLLDGVAEVVPFVGGEATINDGLLMLELIDFLGCISVEESGFEGLDPHLAMRW